MVKKRRESTRGARCLSTNFTRDEVKEGASQAGKVHQDWSGNLGLEFCLDKPEKKKKLD